MDNDATTYSWVMYKIEKINLCLILLLLNALINAIPNYLHGMHQSTGLLTINLLSTVVRTFQDSLS